MYVMSSEKFVNKLEDIAVNYKTLYILGCFGAPMNAANKKRYTNNLPYNKKRANIINSSTPDTFGFDCVCLIKGVLWGWNGDKSKTYGGAVYCSNDVPDVGADQIMNYCTDVSSDFNNLTIGEVLHMSGHVGVYIGNGLAVECTPKWGNDVQITAVANIQKKSGYNNRIWSNHGKLKWIEYIDSNPSVDDKQRKRTKGWQMTMNRVYNTGLDVDGSYGYISRSVANKHYLYKKAIVTMRIRNDYVKWLQKRLKELGYNIEIYGSFWKDTDTVVRQFQRDRGLKVDGKVGANTVAELLK